MRIPEEPDTDLLHLVGESHALLPDDVVGRYSDVLEEDLGGVGAAHPHLVDPLGDCYA